MITFTLSAIAAKALDDYFYNTRQRGQPIRRAPGTKPTDDPQTMITEDYNHAALMRKGQPGETLEEIILRLASEPR